MKNQIPMFFEIEPVTNLNEFVPVGDSTLFKVENTEIPQTIDELPIQISRVYDLSVTAAGQLNIPVVGSVTGGASRRVIVLERAAYKEIVKDNITYQYGYAIRLAITVNKLTADVKMTLSMAIPSARSLSR